MRKNRFYFADKQKTVNADSELKKLISRCCDKTLETEEFGCPAEISVTFMDNEGIRALNREERGIDKETDVLSFPLIDDEEETSDVLPDGVAPLGDIVLSLEKAAAQAQEYGHSFEREVAFLTVHSMLHLLGYDHMESEDDTEMFAKQEQILSALGITRE
jgi:probable rRNA maturation factor